MQNDLDRETCSLQELEAQKQDAQDRLDEMDQQKAKLEDMLNEVRQKCQEESQMVSASWTRPLPDPRPEFIDMSARFKRISLSDLCVCPDLVTPESDPFSGVGPAEPGGGAESG